MPSEGRPQLFTDEQTDIADLFDLLAARPPWHADALCREPARAPAGYPEPSWFPELGQALQAEGAKAMCARCLVRPECLAWAMTQDADLAGIWGGTTINERKALRRRQRRAA